MSTKIQKNKKVFVAMSGGVDSSVAAALLIKKGYSVVGAHIKCFNVDGCGEKDAEDARRVAEQLKIPFYVFDLEKEYKKLVVKYMIDGYKKGLTPNPDVMCNKEIKFGLFLKRALELGADYIATGHYVRLRAGHYSLGKQNNSASAAEFSSPSSRRVLLRQDTELGGTAGRSLKNNGQLAHYLRLLVAKDKNKDQSYFLWTLTQEQLKHCLFPIGEYTKPQVRKLAKKFRLLTAEKKDSQGICFLGRVKLDEFLGKYIEPKIGQVKLAQSDGSYKVVGQHKGAQFYTIGQRHGFRIKNQESGIKNVKPHYIIHKDIKNNTLTVAEGDENLALYKKEIELININLINPQIPNSKLVVSRAEPFLIPVKVRVRHRQPLATAKLTPSQGVNFQGAKLIFNQSQKFIAPGQSAVFYNAKGEMLGGGIIV